MVQAQGASDLAATERQVFEFNLAKNLLERCSSVDAYDQVVVLGVSTNKHHVLPFLKDHDSDSNRVSHYNPLSLFVALYVANNSHLLPIIWIRSSMRLLWRTTWLRRCAQVRSR